mgnify:CR=1 FL=1
MTIVLQGDVKWEGNVKIVFITPTAMVRRIPGYRFGGKIYGHPNSITGPLILGSILKKAGHEVEVYDECDVQAGKDVAVAAAGRVL